MTGLIGNSGNFHFSGNFHLRFAQAEAASNSANSSAKLQAGANGNAAVGTQQAKVTPDTASPAQPNSNLPANATTITAAATAAAADADTSQSAAATAAAPLAQSAEAEGSASPTLPQWLGKRAASGAADDEADNGDTATSAAAAAATPAATANPATSIAAATMPNAIADAPPSADNVSAAGLTIGTQLRARVGLARLGSQNSQNLQAGQQSASAPGAANAPADAVAAKPDAPADRSAAAPPSSEASAQSTPANGASLPQGEAAASATTDFMAAHAGPAVAAPPAAGSGSANPQNATAAVQSATANLPTFAVATAAAATGQAAAAAPASALGAAVPVAGLPIVIAARAQAGVNQFDIRLDPPELGRIDVRLGVDANGQVTSHVTVDRPETLTLLQSQQPQLERALEQAGLRTADNGLQFSLRDQSFAGGDSGGGQPSPAQQLVIPDADLSPVETSQIYSRWGLGTGVDIRV